MTSEPQNQQPNQPAQQEPKKAAPPIQTTPKPMNTVKHSEPIGNNAYFVVEAQNQE
ncbi:hypothetical protein H6F93_01300 [Leptolyngbya sp. FACHB-671]|uniref:hypothetical protein n=1 Tax=Leptolyngbya sp. FACHB-671 TaxID=2692812 RepID=UPI001689C0F4|nr:hypothetical protein [Leptolyngbya sp. FACHB-671]MBD2066175.1 hypothetical protein [Leptolyngbya sp. FACHB-671]